MIFHRSRFDLVRVTMCGLTLVSPRWANAEEDIVGVRFQLNPKNEVVIAANNAILEEEPESAHNTGNLQICLYEDYDNYFVELVPSPKGDWGEAYETVEIVFDEKTGTVVRRPLHVPAGPRQWHINSAYRLAKTTLEMERIRPVDIQTAPRLFIGTDGEIPRCSIFRPVQSLIEDCAKSQVKDPGSAKQEQKK